MQGDDDYVLQREMADCHDTICSNLTVRYEFRINAIHDCIFIIFSDIFQIAVIGYSKIALNSVTSISLTSLEIYRLCYDTFYLYKCTYDCASAHVLRNSVLYCREKAWLLRAPMIAHAFSVT